MLTTYAPLTKLTHALEYVQTAVEAKQARGSNTDALEEAAVILSVAWRLVVEGRK